MSGPDSREMSSISIIITTESTSGQKIGSVGGSSGPHNTSFSTGLVAQVLSYMLSSRAQNCSEQESIQTRVPFPILECEIGPERFRSRKIASITNVVVVVVVVGSDPTIARIMLLAWTLPGSMLKEGYWDFVLQG